MNDKLNSAFMDDPDFQSLMIECLESLQRGESIDRHALREKFPKYANDLDQYLDVLNVLDQFAGGLPQLNSAGDQSSPYEATVTPHSVNRPSNSSETIRYIGEYEVLEEIARGGMGVVFKARQETLKRTVALKMILSGRLADSAEIDRFRREAQAASRLQHPNIVSVHEIGEHDGRQYFTMDYVEGQSLADEIREESLAPGRAATLVKTVAEAVQFAHEKGTLHRDLKPANILLTTDDSPHVTDFGLAKILDEVDEESRAELTASGQILGTPSYMSPEQAAGKHSLVGPASDIYSLGAILYACLTGRAPFVADSPVDTLMQVIHQEPVSPRQLNAAVPVDLETICLKCLNKEPYKRYDTSQALADDLQRYREGRPVLARPVSSIERGWRWTKRNPVVATLLLVVGVLLITGTTVSSILAVGEHSQRLVAEQAENDANDARQLEQEAREDAEAERDAADKARDTAEARREELRRQLYIAHMAQAQQDWKEGNIPHMKSLLAQHIPEPGDTDLRGFEWRYLNNLLHSSRVTIESPTRCWGAVCDPNGEWVATIGPQTVDVHNLDTGELIVQFENEQPGDQSLAVDRMGRFLAGGHRTLQIWDMEARQALWKLVTPDAIREMMFTQDGRSLYVLHTDARNYHGVVRVYDVETSEIVSTIEFPLSVWTMAIDPAANHLFYVNNKGFLNCRDLSTGQHVWESPGFHGGNRLAIDSTGQTIAGLSSGEIILVDARSGERLSRWDNLTTSIETLSFDPTGERLVIGGDARTAFVINLKTRQIEHALRGHESSLRSVQFRPGYNQIVSTELEGRTMLWDLESPQGMVQLAGNDTYITDAVFSPHGDWLATSHGVPWDAQAPGNIRFWNLETLQADFVLNSHEGGVFGIDVNADGTVLVSGGSDHQVMLRNLESRELLATFDAGDIVRSVDLSRSGRYLAGGTHNGQVLVWDISSQRLQQSNQLRGQIHSVEISPDENFFAACDHEGFRIWDLSTNDLVLESTQQDTLSLTFNHTGDRLAVGSLGRTRLYDTRSWELIWDWAAHNPPVNGIAFNSDDTVLTTRATDGQVKIWDIPTRQNVLTFEGNSTRRNDRNPPLISPDESLMLAGLSPHSLELWNTREHSPPVPQIDHEFFIQRALQYSRNQQWPEALDAYERAIAAEGVSPWNVVAATEIGVMIGDSERARQLCRRAAEIAEEYEDQNITLAGRLVRSSQLIPGIEIDLEKSISIAERSWEKSNNYEGLALLFTLSRAERDEQLLAAVDEMFPALGSPKFRSTALHLKAISEYRLDLLDEANTSLERASQQFSSGMPPIGRGRSIQSDHFDWFVMALTSQAEANELASKQLDEALEANPDSVELLAYRGEFHRRWHRWDKAYADYRRAAELRPEETQYFEYAAITALLAGDRKACAELTAELIRRGQQPEGVDAGWAAGRIAALATPDVEITEELIEAVAQSTDMQPSHWWRRLALAGLLHRAGRHDQSLQQLDLVDMFNKGWQDRAATGLWRTLVLLAQNDLTAARDSFVEASRLIEDRMQPPGVALRGQFTIAELFLLREEAQQRLAAAMPPSDDKSLNDPYLQQLAEFNQQLDQNPDDHDLLINKIELLLQLQRWKEAFAEIEKAMKLSPLDSWRPAQGLMLATLLQNQNAIEGYSKLCQDVVNRKNERNIVREHAALALCLVPSQIPDPDQLLKDIRATENERFTWQDRLPFLFALLRSGHFEEFEQHLQSLKRSAGLQSQAIILLMEAIAAKENGRTEEARRKLHLVQPIVKAIPKGFVPNHRQQLIALVLLQDVEQLLDEQNKGSGSDSIKELKQPLEAPPEENSSKANEIQITPAPELTTPNVIRNPLVSVPGDPQVDPEKIRQWIKQLDSTSHSDRLKALNFLAKAEAEAVPAVPRLLKFFDEEDSYQTIQAIRCFAAIGPQGAEAAPKLHEILKDSERFQVIRFEAGNALARMGKAGEVAIPTLIEIVKDPGPSKKQYVKKATAPEALGLMTPLIRKDENGGYTDKRDLILMQAISCLGLFGSAARHAGPVLEQVRDDTNSLPATQKLARETLKSVLSVDAEGN